MLTLNLQGIMALALQNTCLIGQADFSQMCFLVLNCLAEFFPLFKQLLFPASAVEGTLKLGGLVLVK